ncbi:hypothetical protein GGR56DRAFT_106390 [Xylariaceae sp. FL0804]|nr:hypothetical protein GGR56DRAFT_106390 [Xylariaceae sp. FL0804]
MWFNKRGHHYMALGAKVDDEESLTRDSKEGKPSTADGSTRPARRKTRWQGLCICGSIWGLTVLSAVLLIYLLLAIARSLWGLEDDPDKIFDNFGKPGTGTEGLEWYPTNFLRDVISVPCHSHNDYWRRVPLYSALHAGCQSVEADIWLFDGNPELYVGHERAALTERRTLKSLYINPLVELLNQSNPATPFYNDSRRGVFDTAPDQTLVLLVDVKTDGATAWPHVIEQLEPLRSRNWLTTVEDGVVHERQVTVIGTGNSPFDSLGRNSTYREVFFDAPLGDMGHDVEYVSAHSTSLTYNVTNSFYASADLRAAVGYTWGGFNKAQLQILRRQIRGAHQRGLKVRYFNTPAWPVNLRNKVWRQLMKEGADVLNVDDLRAAVRKRWSPLYVL